MNIEKIKQEFWETIEKYDRFLLCLHRYVDMDSFASNLAMWDLLVVNGKTVTLLGGENESFPKNFEVFADEMKFICRGTLADINQSDYDCIILLDVAGEDRLYDVNSLQVTIPKVVIDHHAGNNISGAEFSFIDPSRSSTAEMVAELGFIDSEEFKSYIYMGIYADTMGFLYNMSGKVFEILKKVYSESAQNLVTKYQRTVDFSDLGIIKTGIEKMRFITNKQNEGFSIAVIAFDWNDTVYSKNTGPLIELMGKHSALDVLVVVTPNKPGSYRLRVRSYIPGGHARSIAELFDGSGHNESAGAIIRYDQYKKLDDIIKRKFA